MPITNDERTGLVGMLALPSLIRAKALWDHSTIPMDGITPSVLSGRGPGSGSSGQMAVVYVDMKYLPTGKVLLNISNI